MKIKHKALLLTLCAVLLVAAGIFGTIAYLTDKDAVTNTFTVGSVGLTLDEAKVNDDGKPVGEDGKVVSVLANAERVKENSYHLLPGHSYTKDPTVTVDAKSEMSYVRMMVTITYKADADAVFAAGNGVTDWININSNWTVNGDPETTKYTEVEGENAVNMIKRVYEFRYKSTVNDKSGPNEDGKLEPLFTTITVPGAVTNADIAHLADMQIVVTAHAIQADGFTDADAAWAAFDGQ